MSSGKVVIKSLDHKFSLSLWLSLMFCVHVMYTPCSKLPNCHICMKYVRWQLRPKLSVVAAGDAKWQLRLSSIVIK